jgi:hypothetical protein
MNNGDHTTSSEAATWSMIAGRYPVPSGSNHIVPVDTARRMTLNFLNQAAAPKITGRAEMAYFSGDRPLGDRTH